MDRTGAAYETTYEPKEVIIEQTSVINVGFIRSLSGMLKMAEILLSCIVLICVAATSGWSSHSSGGWVNFVAAITLICATIFFIFYLFNLIRKLPGPWVIIEFAILIICTFFWFITLIVSSSFHYVGGGAIASAVFSAVALAVYITELATRFKCERQPNGFKITMSGIRTTQTHTTVTSTVGQPTEPHTGYAPSYAPGERTDAGYGMP